MHGALFFLAFTLIAWGALVRFILARSLLAAVKSYFWTVLFIGILFLFQHVAVLGTLQLLQIFPGLVLLITLRERFQWQAITYPRPTVPRLMSAGLLLLALLSSFWLLLNRLPAGQEEVQLRLAAGLGIVALTLAGLAARAELVLVFFLLSFLFQGAALSLVALLAPDDGEMEALGIILVLAGPILLGVGAYLLVLLEKAQPGASRGPLHGFKF